MPEKAFNLFLRRILINTGNEYDKKVNVGDSFRKLNFKWKEMEGLEKKKKREKEIVILIVRGWRWGEMDDSALSTRTGLLELSLRQ